MCAPQVGAEHARRKQEIQVAGRKDLVHKILFPTWIERKTESERERERQLVKPNAKNLPALPIVLD